MAVVADDRVGNPPCDDDFPSWMPCASGWSGSAFKRTSWVSPDGIAICTASLTLRPIKARPMGETTQMRPGAGSHRSGSSSMISRDLPLRTSSIATRELRVTTSAVMLVEGAMCASSSTSCSRSACSTRVSDNCSISAESLMASGRVACAGDCDFMASPEIETG